MFIPPWALSVLCVNVALAMTEVNGPGPADPQPQIAMYCGRVLLYMNTQTGQWEHDPQGRQGCFTEPSQFLSYCQEMYPNLQISHAKEATKPVTIPFWCKKGWGYCQNRPFIVVPYRCVEGEYVSEALLVPDRCRFLHQEQMDACESYVYWHNIAKEACTAESLELHSYGMLLPCGDHYRGVEYVCCPGRSSSTSKGETEGEVPAVPQDDEVVEEEEEEEEEEEVDEDDVEDDEEEDEEGAVAVKDPEEYEYPIDSVTTPRPTDGVDVYFEKPVDETEHANFLRAKTDLEERRMKRINEIMKEWAEADNQSKNLPKSERQALNEHFQSVLQTLEEQVAGERQRLVETHLARVEAILNNNRRLALENYLTAVQSDPPQPERVLQALKRYIAAEQKDRRHTLRHYRHIVAVDPQKAEQMKFQVYTHLHVIEERMNQSLALLYKDPTLAKELHSDIRKIRSYNSSFNSLHSFIHLQKCFMITCGSVISNKMMFIYELFVSKVSLLISFFPQQPDALETFNRGAMVGLLVVAVAIAMVMVISLLLVRRKPYGTISHGIVEVDPMLTPEERQLNKMQNHGYENPTYKFFEQMN
uniref:Amyloid beta (A4) precursor-like protein 1 n=1 Tax=Sphaeramia orbicularis TaxID=375764 RepID=A0A673AIQ8_9TELE